jgi:hypothetical protein
MVHIMAEKRQLTVDLNRIDGIWPEREAVGFAVGAIL